MERKYSARNPRKAISLLACIGLLSGCATVIKSDKIVTIKQRTFGLLVGTSPVNQTPEVKLGFITTVFHLIPTSTNAINAPRYFDTFEIDQNLNPFNTDVRENMGSGDVTVGTNATGSAIIPSDYLFPHAKP